MGAGIYKYLETCLWTHFLLTNVGVPIKYVHRHLEKNIVWALFLPSNVGTFSGLQCGGAHHSGLTTSPNQREVSSPPPTLTPNASKPTRSQQRKKDRNPEAVFGAFSLDLGRLAAFGGGSLSPLERSRFQVSERWTARGGTRLQISRKFQVKDLFQVLDIISSGKDQV